MKQAANSLKMAIRLSNNLVPFFLLAFAIPVFALIGFGAFTVYRDGYLLHFAGIIAAGGFLGAGGALLLNRKARKMPRAAGAEETIVKAQPDWSDYDNRVWAEVNERIGEFLAQDSKWAAMREHAVEMVIFTAERYHGKNNRRELAFSAPELLKMIEEVSRRYRRTLKAHVPFIESVNLSTLKMFYDHKEKAHFAGKAWDAYRTYRIFTPPGLLAEARGLLLKRFFSGVRVDLEFKMKQALLQEVAAVSIDLYSGRFRVDDDELEVSRAHAKDGDRMAPPPEPLRVCLLGQVSAGKSSIINALTGSMAAEVNMLPSTDRVSVYQCRVEGLDLMHLVDLPGLNGEGSNRKLLLREITESDVVLWVVKANQSARHLDVDFLEAMEAFYAGEKNRSRKRPLLIGVLNQVDRLKPVNAWDPPYDLDAPASPKARIIRDALAYNENTLKLDKWLPLSVSTDKAHFNLDRLQSIIAAEYESAIQTQLNRRRLESGSTDGIAGQCRRLLQAGKLLFGVGPR